LQNLPLRVTLGFHERSWYGMERLMEDGAGSMSGSAEAEVLVSFPGPANDRNGPVMFQRRELDEILHVYSLMVGAGEWRDYAIDALRDRAVFSIFRRTSEVPLFRIEKTPRLARRQGAFSVLNAGGMVMKRGHELRAVLRVFDRLIRLATRAPA
jgi:hypothetical protein